MSQALVRRIEGRHVLFALVAFFGVMFAANGAFVYLALSTFGGIETENAYRKGLDYNKTLAEAGAQAALGWRPVLAYDATAGVLTLEVADQTGAPVTGLAVQGMLMRPATSSFDQKLERFEEHAGGVYLGHAPKLEHGTWIADLVLTSPKGIPFRLRERLWLEPKS
jgi:nitrogen fixation protein FixH